MTQVSPLVHHNGTSKNVLLDANIAAIDALYDALLALRRAAPNGRDFYPISNVAFLSARLQHDQRINRILETIEELTDVASSISAQ